MQATKIDVHAHYVPEAFIEPSADGYSVRVTDTDSRPLLTAPNRTSAGGPSGQMYSMDQRLRDMDSQGVDMHILSVSPLLFDYSTPPEQGTQVCRTLNDAFAKTVEGNPKRFQALAHLPLQAPEEAARELERCVQDLGFRGAIICSNIAGQNLDEKAFAPFYAKMQALDVPVFIHPQNVIGAERLSRYHLGNLIGNPTDTAVAAASLIFGGVLKEFPRLKFYLAHGGGTCPYIRGRWEHGWHVRPEAKLLIQRPPSEYFRLLYFDSLTYSVPALQFLVQSVGAERVMLGTDYPADMAESDPVKRISDLPGVTDHQKDLIFGDNAEALFKL